MDKHSSRALRPCARRHLDAGVDATAALNGGYHLAFLMGGLCAAAAALIGAAFMRTRVAPAAAQTTAH